MGKLVLKMVHDEMETSTHLILNHSITMEFNVNGADQEDVVEQIADFLRGCGYLQHGEKLVIEYPLDTTEPSAADHQQANNRRDH